MVQSVQEFRDQITISPFRFDLRREGGGDVVDFDSSEGREDGLYSNGVSSSTKQSKRPEHRMHVTYPGCDIAVRLRVAADRRGPGAAGPAGTVG